LDTILVKNLIDVLNKESIIYEGILKLSKEKTDVIVEGKVTELEGITRAEQAMILQLGKLEKEREALVDELAGKLGVKPEKITVSELEKILPKEQSKELKECSNKMTGLINDLRDTNGMNSRLIKNSLDYIDFSINVLSSAGSSDIYGKSGLSNDGAKRNFFDMKL
jgi:flagellar biosynthesis/type III secretory pathway chaperone